MDLCLIDRFPFQICTPGFKSFVVVLPGEESDMTLHHIILERSDRKKIRPLVLLFQ